MFARTTTLIAVLVAITLTCAPPVAGQASARPAQSLKKSDQDEVRVKVADPRRPLGKRYSRQLSNSDLQNSGQARDKTAETMSNTLKVTRGTQTNIIKRLGERERPLSNSDLQNSGQARDKTVETMSNTSKVIHGTRTNIIRRLAP